MEAQNTPTDKLRVIKIHVLIQGKYTSVKYTRVNLGESVNSKGIKQQHSVTVRKVRGSSDALRWSCFFRNS